jgi:integrase
VPRPETQSTSGKVANHRGTFSAVLDSRKRKIRGLWMRNGQYYAQIRVDRGNGKTMPAKIPLEAETLDVARAELEKKRTENRQKVMHLPGHRPKFSALAAEYQTSAEFLAKKPGTRENETQALNRWNRHLGGIRIDWIKSAHLVEFRNARTNDGVTARTINLDFVVFNNAMSYAKDKEWLTKPPRLSKLPEKKPAKRPLLRSQDIAQLLKFCVPEVTKNDQIVAFYIRFLALSGAREQESLKTRKTDANFDVNQLAVGATGDTKNSEYRIVDMSPELEALLKEMLSNLPDDTSYLFPSPQRGKKDIHARSLRESFKLVRDAAGLSWVGFHDFRHFFCSTCVMAGIDFMTIASWVGHKDGGVLIGRVYGHLADEHKKKAAAKLAILEKGQKP